MGSKKKRRNNDMKKKPRSAVTSSSFDVVATSTSTSTSTSVSPNVVAGVIASTAFVTSLVTDLLNWGEETTVRNEMVLTTEEINFMVTSLKLTGYRTSHYFIIGLNLSLAKQDDAAADAFKRGAENDGCVGCMYMYVDIQCERNNIHLALPWLIEASIRGHSKSADQLTRIYLKTKPARCPALACFWVKMMIELGILRNTTEEWRKEIKNRYRNKCRVCAKQESEKNNNDVTLVKCGICKFYSYCGKYCQTHHWKAGKHSNECRQVILLRKYCKPSYVKEIREAIIGGQDPKEIDTLQRLRKKLGLIRPKEEYEELLLTLSNDNDNDNSDNNSNSKRPDPYEYIVARKDGTVNIGSTPNII